MKKVDLKTRLRKDRPMAAVTIRMPEDVVDDLKEIAPTLGFSGYQPLIRFYVGQGLRADLGRRLKESEREAAIAQRMKDRGLPDAVIAEVMAA